MNCEQVRGATNWTGLERAEYRDQCDGASD